MWLLLSLVLTMSLVSGFRHLFTLPRRHASFSSSSLSALPSLPLLPSGDEHPVLGFGTYKVGYIPASAASAVAGVKEETADTATVVSAALNVGYRFLDCAEFYGNEASVGEGIREWGGSRSDLFLASKVWTTTVEKGPDSVRSQVLRSLSDLGAGYLDLCCVHWPVAGSSHVRAFEELVRCKEEGLVRDVGLSNYAVEDYEEIPKGLRRHVAVNQIEVNPFLYRKDTIEFFQVRAGTVRGAKDDVFSTARIEATS